MNTDSWAHERASISPSCIHLSWGLPFSEYHEVQGGSTVVQYWRRCFPCLILFQAKSIYLTHPLISRFPALRAPFILPTGDDHACHASTPFGLAGWSIGSYILTSTLITVIAHEHDRCNPVMVGVACTRTITEKARKI